MATGLAGNGRKGRWYIEVEEEIETENHTLLIEHPETGDQVQFPLVNAPNDLDDLVAAIQQAKREL